MQEAWVVFKLEAFKSQFIAWRINFSCHDKGFKNNMTIKLPMFKVP